MNVVALVGRLVRDPELRHTQSGQAVANMRIAVDRAGQREGDEIKAGFFDVTAWGNQAETCAQYLSKGRELAVQGELRFREWVSQEGQKRNAVEVNAFRVTFIGGRGEDDDGQQRTRYEPQDRAPQDDFGGPPPDDDIPF